MDDKFDQDLINELAYKWLQGTITEEEKAVYNKWAKSFDYTNLELPEDFAASHDLLRERLHSRILNEISEPGSKGLFHLGSVWYKVLIAAILALITGLVFILISYYQKTPLDLKAYPIAINVPAGGNKAVLILSDGRKVSLSDSPAGTITGDQGVKINKTTDGELIYSTQAPNAPKVNTIVIPWGGQYRLQLPDGTKVWLNAATTLKYPTSFIGMRERRVELSGEAYLEVTPDKSKPFIVNSQKQQVKVLGTHFNINAYPDEERTITTLEEGSVQVSAGKRIRHVKPGQETVLLKDNAINVQQADLNIALAWKNNKMAFKDAGIQGIMKQVARWYNIQVEYQGTIPDDTITGTISRSSNLSSVLKMFESMDIKFKLEQTPKGKKLIIKP